MNDKLEDKNLETTLNEENAKLLNNINGKENISGIMATEKELENYNEILSFLKEELKVQEKSKFLKTLWNLVFIMGVVGTLFLFFQCINGQLGRIESISLVTFSIGDIIILMINNSIYTDSILVIKRQITDLENNETGIITIDYRGNISDFPTLIHELGHYFSAKNNKGVFL